jgi:molybdopterin synthase catalytic subunit
LKTKAPFWKREDRAGGDGAWVDAREEDNAAASRWG